MENTVESLLTIIIACVALIISLISFFYSKRFQDKDFDYRMASEALNNFVSVEQMIKDIPTAIYFHGITKEDLIKAELTNEEFSYLLSNITAGGIYYRTTSNTNLRFFGESEYYDLMFRSEKTRKAWPIVRRCMAPSNYRDELDLLLTKHNSVVSEIEDQRI